MISIPIWQYVLDSVIVVWFLCIMAARVSHALKNRRQEDKDGR